MWTDALKNAFATVSPRSVLDLGCGPFRDAPYAETVRELLSPAGHYRGVDLTDSSIAEHHKLVCLDRRFTYYRGDFMDMPVDNEKYDLVLTKCFVCLFYGQHGGHLQRDVVDKIKRHANWWLFYDSFDYDELGHIDDYLKSLGDVFWLIHKCEMNPDYTRLGLLKFDGDREAGEILRRDLPISGLAIP